MDNRNKNYPFFTVITPVKNGEYTIQRTIDSIKKQTYTNFEYIIIDCLSSDKTDQIINANKEFIKTYIREKDEGIYDAMNKGIKLAMGEYITIINSDDYLHPKAFEKVYQESLKQKKNTVFYSDMYVFYKDNKILSKGKISEKSIYEGTLSINHPTIFIPRSIYMEFGIFKNEFKYSADRELIMRLLNKKVSFKKLNYVLSSFSLGGTTSTYSFKSLKRESLSEYKLLRTYTCKKVAFKRSIIVFLRLFRNLILFRILPKDLFLRLRISKLR